MNYIIGRYDRDNLFSLVLGCQHILIMALDFFQHSGHVMVFVSCKAPLLIKSVSESSFVKISSKHLHSQNIRAWELIFSRPGRSQGLLYKQPHDMIKLGGRLIQSYSGPDVFKCSYLYKNRI